MSDYFGKVRGGEIVRHHVKKIGKFKSLDGLYNVLLGKDSTDQQHIDCGYLPYVGERPPIDNATQTVSGPSYVINGSQIDKIYTVTDLALEDIKQNLKNKIVVLMAAKQDGGIFIACVLVEGELTGGTPIVTSGSGLADLNGAKIENKPEDRVIIPRNGGGSKMVANQAALNNLFSTVAIYRQDVMTYAGTLIDQVEAGTPVDTEAGWPTNRFI